MINFFKDGCISADIDITKGRKQSSWLVSRLTYFVGRIWEGDSNFVYFCLKCSPPPLLVIRWKITHNSSRARHGISAFIRIPGRKSRKKMDEESLQNNNIRKFPWPEEKYKLKIPPGTQNSKWNMFFKKSRHICMIFQKTRDEGWVLNASERRHTSGQHVHEKSQYH